MICCEEFFGYLWRDASAASCIFSIYDAKIDTLLTFNSGKLLDDCLSAGLAYNISKKKNAHLI